MSFKDDVRSSLTDIKVKLGEYNVILQDHHVRSSNHEARIKPLEDHVLFINRSLKSVLALAGLVAAVVSLIKYFHS